MTSLSKHIKTWKAPVHARDLPAWPHMQAGHLVEGHASWRSHYPEFSLDRCMGCLQCYLLCPDAAIRIEDGALSWEQELCKGCGLCARECRHGAIEMAKEKT